MINNNEEQGVYISIPITLKMSWHPQDFDSKEEFEMFKSKFSKAEIKDIESIVNDNIDFLQDTVNDNIYEEVSKGNFITKVV